MKYCLVVLSALFFLAGCSGNDTTITSDAVADSEASADIADNADADETDAEDTDGEDEANEDTEGVDQQNVRLVVEDQTTAGQIIVEEVATSRDGWVSVHKSQEGGGILLPESIGEARVDSGDSEDIIVDLWEAPAIGEKLWVLLHIDAGERGTYEFPGEDQAVRKNGETMARSFVIQDPDPDDDEDEEDDE